MAAEFGHREVVEVLVPNFFENLETGEALLRAGANINAVSKVSEFGWL